MRTERGGGDAGINRVNKMILETLSMESRHNKMPFNAIKSLGKIKLEEEGFMIPRSKIERVDNFLGNNNVRSYVFALNKSCLGRVDDVREMVFEAINKRFGNDFIADITKANGAKIFRSH
jgi:hypothetical protein